MPIKVKRLFALLIDHAICIVMSGFPFSFLLQIKVIDEKYLDSILLLVTPLLYFVLMLFKDSFCKNASFGKKILGLKVVRTNGKKFTIITSFLRNIVIPILFPFEIYYLFAYNRRLGDRLANTEVQNARNTEDGSVS